MTHLETCGSGDWIKNLCSSGRSLQGESPEAHAWSGWPGAYCQKCGRDDPQEACLAENCLCACHETEDQPL